MNGCASMESDPIDPMEGEEVIEHHFAEDDDFDMFFSELNVRF